MLYGQGSPPSISGGPAPIGPPHWTSLIPPLTRESQNPVHEPGTNALPSLSPCAPYADRPAVRLCLAAISPPLESCSHPIPRSIAAPPAVPASASATAYFSA